MAKTAINQLQDQIEAIRREAYTAGYAAAMQAIRDLTTAKPAGAVAPVRRGRPAAAATPARRGRPAKAAAAPTPPRRGRPPAAMAKPARAASRRRPQRGSNARLIAEVLKALPSGTGRPADIRKALQSDKGRTMAYTSIRHALGQLSDRGEAGASADGKTWHYLGS
jgi:hypothetical protein